jgi:hypothetical protein
LRVNALSEGAAEACEQRSRRDRYRLATEHITSMRLTTQTLSIGFSQPGRNGSSKSTNCGVLVA